MRHDLHMSDTSHTWVSGDRVEPDEQQARTPHRGLGGPFIVKGHMTDAHATL